MVAKGLSISIILDANHEKNCREQPRFFFLFTNLSTHTELEASLSVQGVHRVSLGKVKNEHLPSSAGPES